MESDAQRLRNVACAGHFPRDWPFSWQDRFG